MTEEQWIAIWRIAGYAIPGLSLVALAAVLKLQMILEARRRRKGPYYRTICDED